MHGRGRRWLAMAGLHEWPLTYAVRGESVQVVKLPDDADAAGKLRDMGLYEDTVVGVEAIADPVVLDVLGSRIAISRRLAERILVRLREQEATKEEKMTTTLDKLPVGKRGVIASVSGSQEVNQRLREMGLTVGTVVELMRLAPAGDPIEIRVRGYNLSLRKAEAAGIIVQEN